MSVHPGGEQWTIERGGAAATITQVGATLRTLTAGGRSLLAGFDADEPCLHCRGQVLAPWPNRIADGTYTYGGTQRVLALTEPDRHNAVHGLVGWLPWSLAERTDDTLTARVTLYPQPGWDWVLDLACTYALTDDGLTVTTSATNCSATSAPFGYGAHPYLTAGEAHVDDARLTVPADRYLDVDPVRLLPVDGTVAASTRDVAGPTDLRAGASLAGRSLDVAFTGITADDDGRWRVRLDGPDGGTDLWADAATFGWLQVFTGDALPPAYRRTSGVAVEPLTCPPNAFATGKDVIDLAPGATWSGTWGIAWR